MILKYSWYNFVKKIEAQYGGEYWIMDGSAIFADGDVGDMNHEGYVIQHAQSMLGDSEDWQGTKREMAEEIWELVERNPALMKKAELYSINERTIDSDPENIIASFGESSGFMDAEKWQLFTIANDNYSHHTMDLRDFAMKNWGWKAVRGRNVQTWTLTRSDLVSIADGLGDILGGDEGEEDHAYNLEIRSNNKYFSGIPLSVIESKNPAAIMAYRQVAFG